MVLSGPVSGRDAVMSALARTGALDGPHHDHGLPAHATVDDDHPADDPTVAFLVARAPRIDAVVGGVVKPRGWVLRAHWPTPNCQVCDGTGVINEPGIGQVTCLHCDGVGRTNQPPQPPPDPLQVIADLERRIAVLEGKN